MIITQSSAAKAIPFYMVDSTDHIAPKTGLTPTVTISKNGGTFAAPSGAISEVANGWYKIAGNATDSNTVGALLVHAIATGADPYDIEHEVVVFNVDSATVTVGTNNDKTGYALTAAYDSAKTAASQANVATELNNYGALKPTTAGRTLDVTATGEGGIDWANIGTPTAVQALSATTIGTTTNLTNDPAGVTTLLTRIPAALFSGMTSLSQWLGLIAGKQTGNATARTELRATGAGGGTYDETTDSQEATRDRGDVSWITGTATDPWNVAVPGAYGAGTAGNIVGNNLNATVSSRATPAQVQTELGSYGALKPTVAARTLDVSATGEAGLDWANIGAPTTTQNLSATTIATATTAGSVTNPVTLTAAYDAAKTAATQASVNTVAGYVDTEVAAIKVTTDKLDTALELDGAVYRYTTNSLEQAPTGTGGGGATVAQIWDEPIAGHLIAGSTGAKLNSAGSAGDPWATAIPGAYSAGTAGNILGNRVDAAVSTRATPAQVQTELGTYGGLKPTTPGRTLDVSTGGEAGVDWANVGTPASVNNLSSTTIATVGTLTNAPPDSAGTTTLLTRIPAALFTGITSFAQWLGMLAGKQVGNTTARTELRATGAGGGTYDEVTDSQEAIRDRGDASWITGTATDPWNVALPGAYNAGTAGNIVGGNLNATVSSRATPAQVQTELGVYGALKPTVAARTLDVSTTGEAGVDWANVGSPAAVQNLSATTISTSQTVGSVTSPVALTAAYDAAKTAATQASVNTVAGYIDTEVAAIKSQTDQLVFVGGKVEANAITTPADMNAIADALLKRDWNSVSGEAAYSALNAFRMLRNVWATAGGTLTVKKEDGSTTAWSRPLTVDPTAQPIVGASN
jgi:hypothetical protein